MVKLIEAEFRNKGIRIIRDKQDLGYKGRIKEFMDQIGQAEYVILIISNKYLKSKNCMYELLQIYNNKDFHNRIFPILLDEVKISETNDRVEYIEHWQKETKNLDASLRRLDEQSKSDDLRDDLKTYEEIRNNIGKLTSILSDINTLSAQQHVASDFKQLYELIAEKIEDDASEGLNDQKRARKPFFAIVSISLAVLIIALYGYYRYSDKDVERVIQDDISRVDKASQPDLSPEAIQREGVDSDESDRIIVNTTDKVLKTYDVQLIVPSRMTNAAIFIDGKNADVIRRDLTFITIRVPRKTESHQIVVKTPTDSCVTDRLIKEENLRIPMCN